MNSQFIEELLSVFFKQCSNNPDNFIENFHHSQNIIAFNFRCQERRFTHVSDSCNRILGYNLLDIHSLADFTSKIVHLEDKEAIEKCFRKSFYSKYTSTQQADLYKFTKVKCQGKHHDKSWRYLVIYAQDYWNDQMKCHDKIGLIVDEGKRVAKRNAKTGQAGEHLANSTQGGKKNPTRKSAQNLRNISPRENEVLEMISNGLLSKEIAGMLHISDSTVVTHRKNLISKLKVRNTAELIKKAAKYMLI